MKITLLNDTTQFPLQKMGETARSMLECRFNGQRKKYKTRNFVYKIWSWPCDGMD